MRIMTPPTFFERRHLSLSDISSRLIIYCLMVVTAFVIGKKLAEGGWLTLLFVSVSIPVALACIRYTEYGLALLVTSSVSFFGIYGYTSEAVGIRLPFGMFFISDIVLFLMFIPILRDIMEGKFEWKAVPLNAPLVALLLLSLFQVFRALFIQSQNFHYVMRLARPMIYYSMFFLVLYNIKSKRQLDIFLKLLLFIAVTSGIFVIIQSFFQLNLTGGKVVETGYTIYRFYSPAYPMIASTVLVLISTLSFLRLRTAMPVVFCWAFLILCTLFSFARALWASIAASTMAGFFLLGRKIVSAIKILLIMGILLVAAAAYLGEQKTANLIYPFRDRFSITMLNLAQRRGSYYNRLRQFRRKWDLAKDESIILGVGFRYSDSRYVVSGDPMYRIGAADSSVAHLPFTFGIAGVLLFIWFFLAFFRRAFILLRQMETSLYKGILIGLITVNISILLTLPFSGTLFYPSGICVFTVSWALAELVWEFHDQTEI